jgi:GNAT superfamily N-acetyltransferase
MDTEDILQRILRQRAVRYSESFPALIPLGSARFRQDADRLRLGYATALPGRSDELVARIVTYARSQRLQVEWQVMPERSGESELVPALVAAGFQLSEDLFLMAHAKQPALTPALGASGGGPTLRNASGDGRAAPLAATIQPILNWQLMLAYEYGSRLCFYGETQPREMMVSQRATERWHEQQSGWYHYYAAVADNHLLGGCYVSLFEDIPTVMGVYTMPEARKRGVASQLLTRVVADLEVKGHAVCCLFVERFNPAKNLYTDLGFTLLTEVVTYSLDFK